MVIKASASTEIKQLVTALGGSDEVRRETAIARLSIIGERAVDRLVAAYEDGTRELKVAVLRTLEAIGDRRAIAVARRALGESGDVAIAGASTLRGLLGADHAATATDALDSLVAVALDAGTERRVRLAAFDALRDVPGDVRDRVAAALREDPDTGLQARAVDAPREAATAEAIWQDALEGRLPETPADLREVLQARSANVPLGVIQKLIDGVRALEGSLSGARRAEWLAVRGALHQALALRGSRIAVYDLRETLGDARGPLPLSFLSALHVVGDESCLEAVATAYSQSPADDLHWRHQLAAAFRAIAKRERITKRHPLMKRLATRWPDAAAEFIAPA
jgi:HEAT repeat protein